MTKLRIFCVFHYKLYDECFDHLPADEKDQIVMYATNERLPKLYSSDRNYNIIEEYKLPNYTEVYQDRNYSETSCFFHAIRNNLPSAMGLDYIGFMQYDMILPSGLVSDITGTIDGDSQKQHIFYMEQMHFSHPHGINGKLKDYFFGDNDLNMLNRFNASRSHHASQTSISLDNNDHCNFFLFNTYVIPTQMFVDMMAFMQVYIDDWMKTGKFADSCPAGILERAYGIYLYWRSLDACTVSHRIHIDHNRSLNIRATTNKILGFT